MRELLARHFFLFILGGSLRGGIAMGWQILLSAEPVVGDLRAWRQA
jgi:hypothetical protein